jgi:hypothetical protein
MTLKEQTAEDITQQVRNEIEDTLLMHAPDHWQEEELDRIEENVLSHTRQVVDALSTSELQSAGALDRHIEQAVAETKRLIHERKLGFR